MQTYGCRDDLSVDEAIELGRRAIYHATFRDTASGGTVSVYHVTQARTHAVVVMWHATLYDMARGSTVPVCHVIQA